jgi:hypothetical protein
LQDPISKIPITKKRAGGVAQGEGPEFNISTEKKTKQNRILKIRKLPSTFPAGCFHLHYFPSAWEALSDIPYNSFCFLHIRDVFFPPSFASVFTGS